MTASPSPRPVALITGATGNLGTATARTFLAHGWCLVLIDRSADRLPSLFPALVEAPDHELAAGVDVTDETAMATLVARTQARFGRIDSLVNTVGAWRGGRPVHEEALATWDLMLGVNLRAPLVACRAVIPAMRAQQSGRIVNVASRDGLAGGAGYAAYSAAKSALIRLTEAMADELKRDGLNVNCVLPGTLDTPQNRAAMPDVDPAGWVEPTALADVILFLASPAARAITGAAVPVYGRG